MLRKILILSVLLAVVSWWLPESASADPAFPDESAQWVDDEKPKKPAKDRDNDDSDDDDEAGPDDEDSDDEADKEKEDDDDDEPASKDRRGGKKDAARGEAEVAKKDKDGHEDGKDKKEKKPSPIKKLIEVKLDQYLVPARQLNIPLPGRTRTVRDMIEKFESWSKDEEVGALLLNLDGVMLSIPDIEELRGGLARVRKSGKKVMCYLNAGDDMGYLLACGADEIAIAPTGSLALPGIGRLFPFMRGMYQLQGLEFDVITAGRYKYPGFFNRRGPTRHFTEEFEAILDSWFGDYVSIVAGGRKLQPKAVREAIDVALFDAEAAKNRGLVDVIAYYDEYCDRVVRREKYRKLNEFESDFSRITSLTDLLNAWQKQVRQAQEGYTAVGPKIAVLHARGPIVDVSLGSSFSSSLIMRDEFVRSVEEIRKNKTIRGVVLRIDSPGGSGYASDVIWRHLKNLDEEKPLVVSMGAVAGSGGYYIACPGRLIIAEPTTITGSIGVIYIGVNQASRLSRADIQLAEMKRGARSLLGFGHRDMLSEDRDFIQKFILDFYEIFLDRVAASRKMPKDQLRKIAEGRIYTGRQAVEIGLVDRLGGLADAIAVVREMANIPPSAEIRLVHYPRPSSVGEFVESLAGFSTMEQVLRESQTAAPRVAFDSQLRHFARRPQPLCWMAVPEVDEILWPGAAPSAGPDPLDPSTPTAVLPAP